MSSVRALSPHQTSEWCESLSLCGVRGQLLRQLQNEILGRHIDGKQFDDLLRQNALQELGIQDLNPRLSVAIRRAWHTDFANVSFTSYHPNVHDSRQESFSAPGNSCARPGYVQQGHGQQNYSVGHPDRAAAKAARDLSGSGEPIGRGDSALASNSRDPLTGWSMDHVPQTAEFGRAPLHLQRDAHDVPMHGERQGGIPETSRTAEFEGSRDDQRGWQGHLQRGFSGIQRNPDVGRRPEAAMYPRSGERSPSDNVLRTAEFGTASQNYSMSPESFVIDEAEPGLEDLLPKKPPATRSFAEQKPVIKSQDKANGIATDDWGGGLDSVFAKKDKAPNTFSSEGQHGAAKTVSRSQVGPALQHTDGLSDVLPPRVSRVSIGERDTRYDPVPKVKKANDWGGMGLGDALGGPKKVDARNRYGNWAGGSVEEEPQGQSGGFGRAFPTNSQPSQPQWESSSLGDVLGGHRQPARNNHGSPEDGAVMDRTQLASVGASQYQAPSGHFGFAGTDSSLGDTLLPGSQHQEAREHIAPPTPQRNGKHTAQASPQRGNLSSEPDPWAGVGLGDALGGAKKCQMQAAPDPRYDRLTTKAELDPWAGVGLGDALGAKSSQTAQRQQPAHDPRYDRAKRGAGVGRSSVAAEQTNKTSAEITAWIQTLPESHVPEKSRESLIEVVMSSGMDGNSFTSYCQRVPPEVCAPKHAMKLKAAWNNVLQEAEAKAIAKQNLEHLAKAPGQKAVRIDC